MPSAKFGELSNVQSANKYSNARGQLTNMVPEIPYDKNSWGGSIGYKKLSLMNHYSRSAYFWC